MNGGFCLILDLFEHLFWLTKFRIVSLVFVLHLLKHNVWFDVCFASINL